MSDSRERGPEPIFLPLDDPAWRHDLARLCHIVWNVLLEDDQKQRRGMRAKREATVEQAELRRRSTDRPHLRLVRDDEAG